MSLTLLLDKEIELFEKNLLSYLKEKPNQFVVIKNKDIQFFPSKKHAINYGIDTYGDTGSFLVRQILKQQPKVSMPAVTLGILRS